MAQGAFTYEGLPGRVVFGAGTIAAVADEARRLGIGNALVISTAGRRDRAERVAELLGDRAGEIFAGARMHTPVEVTDAAMALVTARGIDGTVAIGGGSTTGLGKAIALRTDLPQIVIPTTYAGSEMTNLIGETAGGEKTTLRDAKIRPETVIYDVDLTLSLPKAMSINSGLNAMAHGVEALYARDGNPVTSLIAEEGIRALGSALPTVAADPTSRDARSDALYGAWLCGFVLGSASVAIHHKLCHVLGGSFGLPHAETHAVILPHAIAYNAAAAPDAIGRIARALGVSDAPGALYDMAKASGGATSLRDIGMPDAGLDRAADLVLAGASWNPRPIDRDSIRKLLDDAWAGHRPA